MKKTYKKLIVFLFVMFGFLVQAHTQNYVEFVPGLTTDYKIKNASTGTVLTYKGLDGTSMFEDVAEDPFNQAFRFVKVEGDGNPETDEYYIVPVPIKIQGVEIADLEHLNESGVSKIEASPTWHVVRFFKNTDNNTYAIKLVGSDANSSKSKRSTIFIDNNRKLKCRSNDANYNQNPPTYDYDYVFETVVIDYTPLVQGIELTGAKAVQHGTTQQYSAEITSRNHPPMDVTWTLTGATKTGTTLSSTGLLTVAADETAKVLTVKATSDYDNTKSAVISVILITPPATPAPTPVHKPENVHGIFSDHYTCGSFNPVYSDWLAADAKPPVKAIITPFASDVNDHVLFIDSLQGNVAQIGLGSANLLNKDTIHIDIYSPGASDGIGEFDFSFYMGKADWSGGPGWIDAGIWYNITSENRHGEWISLEVPVKPFTDKGPFALVLKLKRGSKGSTGKKLYVDNIYAYASEYIDHTPKVTGVEISGSAATQRGKTVQYKATVSGTDNPPTGVTWTLTGMNSNETTISSAGLLTVAADESATQMTVTATSVYNELRYAKVTVTLIDPPTITASESVDLTSVLPHCPAPHPKHNLDSVKGIFSNVYSYSQFSTEYADWSGSTVKEIIMPFEDEPIETVLKVDGFNSGNSQAQISLGVCNLAGMDSIHIDIYSPGGNEGIGEFDFGLIYDWSGNNHVAANVWLNITEENLHGRWISIDLPLSQFIAHNAKFDVSKVNILRLRRGGKGAQGTKLYVDNVYAYQAGCGGVYPPVPPKPGELEAPTTLPSVVIDDSRVKTIFCEQFETADYQETKGLWDVNSGRTLEEPYVVNAAAGSAMDYGQNKNQVREFVEIMSGDKTIKLTGWNDYPFKIHRTSETMDLSDMTYLHVSAYLASTLVNETACSMTFYMHDGNDNKVDNPSVAPYVNMTPGEWVSISIPLCHYENKVDLSKIYVLRVRLGGYSSMNVYVDNIFAYKGEPIEGTLVAKDCSLIPEPGDPIQDSSAGTLPPRTDTFLGVNLSSASGGTNPGVLYTNYRYPKLEDLYYFNAKGLKLIRLPFRWKRVQRELNGPLHEQDITEMKKVIKEAERLGMWVMLDMHDYCEYSKADTLFEIGTTGYKLWRPAVGTWGSKRETDWIGVTKEHFADVWVKLADAFSDCSNIWGYDLMNEPKGIDINILRDNYQHVINEIRKIDTKTAIVIEGKSYASSVNWPNVSDELKNLTDPANNIIYQAHTYFDKDASGTYQNSYDKEVSNPEIYKVRFDPFIKWCKDNNKKGMIGEFGVPYNGATGWDDRYMVMIDSVFSYLKQNQMTATYWCGGAYYETNHITVQPTENYSLEKSTMLIMQKYIRNFDNGTSGIKVPGKVTDNSILVYPNPVVDLLCVNSEKAIKSVQVFNLFGQLIYERNTGAGQTELNVDFSKYVKGSYILQVNLENGQSSTHKVTK